MAGFVSLISHHAATVETTTLGITSELASTCKLFVTHTSDLFTWPFLPRVVQMMPMHCENASNLRILWRL